MRATDGTGHRGHDLPQHVWVDLSSGRYPGLLIEWTKDGAADWKAWVIWAGEGPIVQQAWIPAKQLSPFDRPGSQQA